MPMPMPMPTPNAKPDPVSTGKYRWSIGEKTGTLFRDGSPTGTEIKQFNDWGGTAHDLVAQANLTPELLAALEHVKICSEDAGWRDAVAHVPELESAIEAVLAALSGTKPAGTEGGK